MSQHLAEEKEAEEKDLVDMEEDMGEEDIKGLLSLSEG